MPGLSNWVRWRDEYPAAGYIAPFVGILVFLAVMPLGKLPAAVEWPLQTVVLAALCFICWPKELPKQPRYWLGSIAVGLVVFCIWVGPDFLAPGYRSNILFSNSLVGAPHSSIPLEAQRSAWVLVWRTVRAALMVPIAEELFWRAWLMRWLVDKNFLSVRLGTYAPLAFFATALLFGSEHGPYWDVGLITGVIYNLWMIRTRSVADCVLMHAATNGVLCAYVLATKNWQYWM